MMSVEDSHESFIPLITSEDVPGLIDDLYGFPVEGVQELQGYSDKNFYLKVAAHHTNDGEDLSTEFVLKITNLEDSRNAAWVDGQTAMMRHLNGQGVACCRPISDVNGRYLHLVSMEKCNKGIRQYGTYIVRLLSYVKGQTMSPLVFGSTLFNRLGVFLAKVQQHLENFTHEYFKKMDDYEWNLTKVVDITSSQLGALDASKRLLAQSVIEAFQTEVVPKCKQLKEGVIHGDFRPENIVVDYVDNKSDNNNKSSPLLGVIDFGDAIRSYVLFDVAITLAHTMLYDIGNCLRVASLVIDGYTSVLPLPTWQLRLLRTCIQARLVQVLVLSYNRYLQLPCNADYILSIERQGGWELVETLQTVSDAEWMRHLTSDTAVPI